MCGRIRFQPLESVEKGSSMHAAAARPAGRRKYEAVSLACLALGHKTGNRRVAQRNLVLYTRLHARGRHGPELGVKVKFLPRRGGCFGWPRAGPNDEPQAAVHDVIPQ